MYRRKKTITLDGAQFTISPLTIDQVEQLVGKYDDDSERPAICRVYGLVAAGLNNAVESTGCEASRVALWDEARVKAELDQITVNWIQDEIFDFSGLKKRDTVAGESSAETPAAI